MSANHPNLNHKAVAKSLTAESVPTREPGTSTESVFSVQVEGFQNVRDLMTKGEQGDLKPFAKPPAIRWRDAGAGHLASKWLPAVRAMDHPTVRSRRREVLGRR